MRLEEMTPSKQQRRALQAKIDEGSHRKRQNDNQNRWSLGSEAASTYYFNDLSQTSFSRHHASAHPSLAALPEAPSPASPERNKPQRTEGAGKRGRGTPKKKQQNDSINDMVMADATATLEDMSASGVLSANSSDTSFEGLQNTSVLSDTTELTASNFVFAASSKTRLSLAELEQSKAILKKGTMAETVMDGKRQAVEFKSPKPRPLENKENQEPANRSNTTNGIPLSRNKSSSSSSSQPWKKNESYCISSPSTDATAHTKSFDNDDSIANESLFESLFEGLLPSKTNNEDTTTHSKQDESRISGNVTAITSRRDGDSVTASSGELNFSLSLSHSSGSSQKSASEKSLPRGTWINTSHDSAKLSRDGATENLSDSFGFQPLQSQKHEESLESAKQKAIPEQSDSERRHMDDKSPNHPMRKNEAYAFSESPARNTRSQLRLAGKSPMAAEKSPRSSENSHEVTVGIARQEKCPYKSPRAAETVTQARRSEDSPLHSERKVVVVDSPARNTRSQLQCDSSIRKMSDNSLMDRNSAEMELGNLALLEVSPVRNSLGHVMRRDEGQENTANSIQKGKQNQIDRQPFFQENWPVSSKKAPSQFESPARNTRSAFKLRIESVRKSPLTTGSVGKNGGIPPLSASKALQNREHPIESVLHTNYATKDPNQDKTSKSPRQLFKSPQRTPKSSQKRGRPSRAIFGVETSPALSTRSRIHRSLFDSPAKNTRSRASLTPKDICAICNSKQHSPSILCRRQHCKHTSDCNGKTEEAKTGSQSQQECHGSGKKSVLSETTDASFDTLEGEGNTVLSLSSLFDSPQQKKVLSRPVDTLNQQSENLRFREKTSSSLTKTGESMGIREVYLDKDGPTPIFSPKEKKRNEARFQIDKKGIDESKRENSAASPSSTKYPRSIIQSSPGDKSGSFAHSPLAHSGNNPTTPLRNLQSDQSASITTESNSTPGYVRSSLFDSPARNTRSHTKRKAPLEDDVKKNESPERKGDSSPNLEFEEQSLPGQTSGSRRIVTTVESPAGNTRSRSRDRSVERGTMVAYPLAMANLSKESASTPPQLEQSGSVTTRSDSTPDYAKSSLFESPALTSRSKKKSIGASPILQHDSERLTPPGGQQSASKRLMFVQERSPSLKRSNQSTMLNLEKEEKGDAQVCRPSTDFTDSPARNTRARKKDNHGGRISSASRLSESFHSNQSSPETDQKQQIETATSTETMALEGPAERRLTADTDDLRSLMLDLREDLKTGDETSKKRTAEDEVFPASQEKKNKRRKSVLRPRLSILGANSGGLARTNGSGRTISENSVDMAMDTESVTSFDLETKEAPHTRQTQNGAGLTPNIRLATDSFPQSGGDPSETRPNRLLDDSAISPILAPTKDSNMSHDSSGFLLDEARPLASPGLFAAKKNGPKSILNSGRRSSVKKAKALSRLSSSKKSRKKIAFGSPVAAEYNLGSPSMSMTPLPSGKVKAMFLMPPANSETSTCSSSSTSSDRLDESNLLSSEPEKTVELENDINSLLQNAANTSVDSSILDGGEPNRLHHDNEISTLESKPIAEQPKNHKRRSPKIEKTVELERDINSWLKNAGNMSVDSTMSDGGEPSHLSHDNDVSTFESQTSAEPPKKRSMKVSSGLASAPPLCQQNNENTVELEDCLAALLVTAGNTASSSPSTVDADTSSASSLNISVDLADARSLASVHEYPAIAEECEGEDENLRSEKLDFGILNDSSTRNDASDKNNTEGDRSVSAMEETCSASSMDDSEGDEQTQNKTFQTNDGLQDKEKQAESSYENDQTVELEAHMCDLFEKVLPQNEGQPHFLSSVPGGSRGPKSSIPPPKDSPSQESSAKAQVSWLARRKGIFQTTGTTELVEEKESNLLADDTEDDSQSPVTESDFLSSTGLPVDNQSTHSLQNEQTSTGLSVASVDPSNAVSYQQESPDTKVSLPSYRRSEEKSKKDADSRQQGTLATEDFSSGRTYNASFSEPTSGTEGGTNRISSDMNGEHSSPAISVNKTGGRPENVSRSSSRRLTLSTPSRIRLSFDGNIMGSTGCIEFTEDSTGMTSPRPCEHKVAKDDGESGGNVSWEDIISAAKLEGLVTGAEILLDSCHMATVSSSGVVVKVANDLLSAVCKEVEKKEEEDFSGRTQFDASIDDEQLKNLHHVLCKEERASSNDEERGANMAFDRLARDVHDVILGEWTQWEAQVAQALNGTIAEIAHNIGEDEELFDKYQGIINVAHESVAEMAFKAERKARRRSFMLKKSSAIKLQEELEDLELTLKREKQLQTEIKSEVVTMSELRQDIIKAYRKEDELQRMMERAIKAENHFKMQESLLSWYPRTIQTSKLSIAFFETGGSHDISVTFCPSEAGPVMCDASLCPRNDVLMSKGREKTSTEARSYLNNKLFDICQSINGLILSSAADVCSTIQRLDWIIHRQQVTARELQQLQAKLPTAIEKDVDGHVSVVVDFTSLKESSKLRACFGLQDSYPSAPMRVHLDSLIGDSELNVEAVTQQLLRNASPGFSYITRVCGVIGSYLDKQKSSI